MKGKPVVLGCWTSLHRFDLVNYSYTTYTTKELMLHELICADMTLVSVCFEVPYTLSVSPPLSPLSLSPSLSTLIRDILDRHDTPELRLTESVNTQPVVCLMSLCVCLYCVCTQYSVNHLWAPPAELGWGQSMSFSVSQFQEI